MPCLPPEKATHLIDCNLAFRILGKRNREDVYELALAAEDAGQLDMVNYLPRSMTSDDLFDLIKLAF